MVKFCQLAKIYASYKFFVSVTCWKKIEIRFIFFLFS